MSRKERHPSEGEPFERCIKKSPGEGLSLCLVILSIRRCCFRRRCIHSRFRFRILRRRRAGSGSEASSCLLHIHCPTGYFHFLRTDRRGSGSREYSCILRRLQSPVRSCYCCFRIRSYIHSLWQPDHSFDKSSVFLDTLYSM